ncbi:MAG TPA: hypothetical protein VMJ10_31240 [Kofleriaceae bacterium]|nr:hypothetical protein [Kofleriaceae bacterium]
MRRSVLVLAIAIAVDARADLENQVYTSKPDQLQIVVPRGWRATDQPTYPGILLSMMRDDPEAHIVLTAEPFTRKAYCSWPIACRTSHDAPPVKLACALSKQLAGFHMRVGTTQAGPRENEANGLPTVWFEYDDGHHFFRQAVALTEDRIVTLLLSTSSAGDRSSYVRAFEQALRTLKPLEQEEPEPAPAATPPDGGVPADGGLPDAGTPTTTPGTFSSAPAPKIHPVGSCA